MSYATPTTLADALEIANSGSVTRIAGGTDIYPAMQQGLQPTVFLDVTRIAEFRSVDHGPAGTRIGAAITWTDLIKAALPNAFDGLKQAALQVGGIQIQNAGTLAGNICNASPAADGVPPLLALQAEVELASQRAGTRVVPLSEFIMDVRHTDLQADELVTAICIPPQPTSMVSAFEKLGSRTHLVISIAMTAVNLVLDDAGRIAEARIAVGACSAKAQRLSALEVALIGQHPKTVQIDPTHLGALSPIDDIRGSATYRLEAAAEQCKRAIYKAARL